MGRRYRSTVRSKWSTQEEGLLQAAKQPVSILPRKILHLPVTYQANFRKFVPQTIRTSTEKMKENLSRPWGLYMGADPSRDTGDHRRGSVDPHLGCVPPPQSDTNRLEWSNIGKYNHILWALADVYLFYVSHIECLSDIILCRLIAFQKLRTRKSYSELESHLKTIWAK